ncbi:hypothetical protein BGZ61DRAFT_465888 [Ilyonectria robusta]|uniref:uncharacterized protein n=1 Tax=Ilyonectria robusta TaxID=1079257 RepID=UPI001E8E5919|nr:uncharacterized protein BGZ61DRAFT_465888 [Ilyonectria robusta]KAH8657368.1 hypothetical protein BGZ61DRAFT_465888 [Ilyonectria robusta]
MWFEGESKKKKQTKQTERTNVINLTANSRSHPTTELKTKFPSFIVTKSGPFPCLGIELGNSGLQLLPLLLGAVHLIQLHLHGCKLKLSFQLLNTRVALRLGLDEDRQIDDLDLLVDVGQTALGSLLLFLLLALVVKVGLFAGDYIVELVLFLLQSRHFRSKIVQLTASTGTPPLELVGHSLSLACLGGRL